jgi:hypothetical protein
LRRSAFFGNRWASAFRLCWQAFASLLRQRLRAWCEPGWQSLLVFVPKQTVIVVIIVVTSSSDSPPISIPRLVRDTFKHLLLSGCSVAMI